MFVSLVHRPFTYLHPTKLDMNGIIHNCTHKDGDSASFRMTEDKMFIAIFNYIEHLFGKIKPKQLFFMAIDGVAPRAKMNQQRARRFRTALDAENAREKAIREGIELPKEAPFDSNCITPGTEFMARLTQQLKYFISKKVSEDADWQNVEVVLSGHEVPGEGEHKIMEYIRQAKSQPNYNPNVRHCLYGLDADLIMLGLLSHDPHFCLLREEVTFGRQSKQKSKELEHQNFYLMHLCTVREYLEFEFDQLKEPGVLSFPFDMERVIDDFILMAFFVGNDFLPNLPHLHINEGALALMFDTYKKVLPKSDGYINDGGTINLKRLALLLSELQSAEYRVFEVENQDASWLRNKQQQDENAITQDTKKGKLVMSSPQKQLWQTIKKWVNKNEDTSSKLPLDLPALPARDREFVKQAADSLHVQWQTVEDQAGERHIQLSVIQSIGDAEDDEDEEAQNALFRVIKRYDNAKIVDVSPEQAREEMQKKYDQKFHDWKDEYYQGKFGWGLENEEELRKLAENYVQGCQWVLYYYYRGVVSWPWYFGYHYSPMISDVVKGLNADMDFKLGQPFRPYQQLMGVLPDRSKTIVPTAYHDLMTNPASPIIDFYPRDFELDMNGKKMEWEAVVKIPFIDEKRLLDAMSTKDHLMTDDERARNEYGVSLKFTYSADVNYTYPSSMPGVFNDIPNCRCVENIYELPTMDGLDVYVGLVEGVKLGTAALAGFPSLKTLPVGGALSFHGVSVFQSDSRNQSMVVTILGAETATKSENAKAKLGKVVHVGYPLLQEAKVVKVTDELFDYTLDPAGNGVVVREHDQRSIDAFDRKAERIESVYSKRLGIIIGTVESMVQVEMLKGLRKTDEGATIKEYAHIENMESEYATQTVVDEVISQDQRFLERAALPVEEEFPINARAFFLGELAYGRPLQIIGHQNGKLKVWVAMSQVKVDDRWAKQIVRHAESNTPYTPSFAVARMLNLNGLVLSKLTSAFSVNSGGLRLNLGLNLKFEAKKLKVLGYSKKGATGWEFSQKAIDLIVQYMTKFPEFIAGIQRNPSGDIFSDEMFYPKEEAPARIKEIGQWLKSVEAKSFEKVPLDADQLDSDTVKLIEAKAEEMAIAAGERSNKTLGGVPRHAILKPSDAEQRLSEQRFSVGDRIIYVQDSGKVPVGLSGTVVGMTRTSRTTLLDIVLDSTFMSGSTLDGRCSPFRGATVPASSVLNLTDRQVVADTRAAAARHAAQQTYGSHYANGANGYGAPVGAGGRGQMFPAQTPAQLAGSWRSAVAGVQSNGMHRGRGDQAPRGGVTMQQSGNAVGAMALGTAPRGRGQQNMPFRPHPRTENNAPTGMNSGATPFAPATNGSNGLPGRGRGRGQNSNGAPNGQANRKGYTVVDNSDPTAGVIKNNPNFRPQSYASVPPPANLNMPGGGRGRGGRGRGRGV